MSLRGPMVSSGLPSAGRKQGWSPEWGGGVHSVCNREAARMLGSDSRLCLSNPSLLPSSLATLPAPAWADGLGSSCSSGSDGRGGPHCPANCSQD